MKWLGHRVETQNYIDDTGVQVADVVVAFQHLEPKSLADVRPMIDDPDVRFDYYCWDVYSKMASYYAAHPEAQQWRRDTLHEIERHEGDTFDFASTIARAIVKRHIATMLRLGITYDLLPKESDIIALHFWDRAFDLLKASGAVIQETEGKHKDCWVMKLDESAEFEGMNEPDKILVRSNGTVTYTGKDIAYQLWKFGLLDRTFNFRKFWTYPDGHVLWETTSGDDGSADAPRFGGAQKVVNVIDVRQAYLQKVVKEGVRQLGHAREAENSIHFSYEMVALTPATAKALGIEVSEEDSKKPYLEMSGRKGLGVKADDLIDALQSKAAESVREGRGEGLTDAEIEAARKADRRRRAPLLHAQVRPQQSHRLRFQRGADVRRRFRAVPAVLDRSRGEHLPQDGRARRRREARRCLTRRAHAHRRAHRRDVGAGAVERRAARRDPPRHRRAGAVDHHARPLRAGAEVQQLLPQVPDPQ